MLYQKNFPKVIWDDGSLTDVSYYMLSFGRDPLDFAFTSTDDLYFGRVKPFSAIFVEMAVPNTAATAMTVEYFNGSTYVPVTGLIDDTRGFTRNGFIQFTQPTDWAASTVASYDQYFVRLSVSVSLSATTELGGINILFSDDQDLNSIYPGIDNYRSSAEASFVLRHQNSRDLIAQEINNRGFRKKPTGITGYESFDAWDFLSIKEVNLWSTYLTLANIFSSLQSKEDGLYRQKADEYEEKAEFYKNAFYLTLDKNDDGIANIDEKNQDISVRRLVRR